MAATLDYSLQVRNTVIQVVYGDVTRIEADALVSSDDVHMSGASGLSRAIRKAAGVRLDYDIRKFVLPRPLGSVLVTSAGRLPAKYILHAVTIGFDQSPQFDVLIPSLIRGVLELAALLQVERLAMPMVNAGLVKVPPEVILRVILEGACCFLADHSSPLQRIILAVYDDEASDHAAAEKQLIKRFSEIQEDITRWQEQVALPNEHLRLLQPVRQQMVDDVELQQLVGARMETAETTLRELFKCPQSLISAPLLADAVPRIGGAPRNRAEYLRAKDRLDTLLSNIQRDIDHQIKVQDIRKRRLEQLELTEARRGIDTPVEVQTELEDLQAEVENSTRSLDRLQAQQQEATQQLAMLTARWERPGNRVDEVVQPKPDEPPLASKPTTSDGTDETQG